MARFVGRPEEARFVGKPEEKCGRKRGKGRHSSRIHGRTWGERFSRLSCKAHSSTIAQCGREAESPS